MCRSLDEERDEFLISGVDRSFLLEARPQKACNHIGNMSSTSSTTQLITKNIMDEVLMEWDIPLSKVAVVITDNGSNMVNMFKKRPCSVLMKMRRIKLSNGKRKKSVKMMTLKKEKLIMSFHSNTIVNV